jgi:biotin carboxylase
VRERSRQDQSDRLDALVLDASQRAALVTVRSLGRAGLHVAAAESVRFRNPPAAASAWSSYAATLPDFATDSGGYTTALERVCEALRPRVVIPVHDATVALTSVGRARFEPETIVALPQDAALAVFVDKSETLALAERVGVRIPFGVPITDPAQALSVARAVGLPAVVKPLESWVPAGDGTATRVVAGAARSVSELGRAAEDLLGAGARLVVQEWLPGHREAVSVVAVAGHTRARFAQVAYRTCPPLGGASIVRESIPLPADAAEGAERIVEEVELDGYAEIEFRRDRLGRAVLMEVNPRLSASVEIAARSGVDFPQLIFKVAMGEAIRPVTTYRTHVRLRWLGGDLLWLRTVLRTPGGVDVPPRPAALARFAADFVRVPHYDYVARDDLRPLFVAAATMTGVTAAGLSRRLRAVRRGNAEISTWPN